MRHLPRVEDFLARSQKRLKAIQTLFTEEAWADVIRESQETLELTLKALLMTSAVEIPPTRDVSKYLIENCEKFPLKIQENLENITRLSKMMNRDGDLIFYGSEDLIPGEFYRKPDAELAFIGVKEVLSLVVDALKIKEK